MLQPIHPHLTPILLTLKVRLNRQTMVHQLFRPKHFGLWRRLGLSPKRLCLSLRLFHRLLRLMYHRNFLDFHYRLPGHIVILSNGVVPTTAEWEFLVRNRVNLFTNFFKATLAPGHHNRCILHIRLFAFLSRRGTCRLPGFPEAHFYLLSLIFKIFYSKYLIVI